MIDKLNEIDLSDPATFEPLFELSSGSFEEIDRKGYSDMHAGGYTWDGVTKIVSFRGTESSADLRRVIAEVCLNVSDVRILDAAGASAVAPDRPDVYGLRATFVADASGKLLVDSVAKDGDLQCLESP